MQAELLAGLLPRRHLRWLVQPSYMTAQHARPSGCLLAACPGLPQVTGMTRCRRLTV